MKIHLSSLILQNFSLLSNDLNKTEVMIEDEDQALLLLCSLPPYIRDLRKLSFMEAN